MFRNFGPGEILILVLLLVIVLGWKRLPDAARSVGRSMRIFKSEVEEMKQDGKATPSAASRDTVNGNIVNPVAPPVQDYAAGATSSPVSPAPPATSPVTPQQPTTQSQPPTQPPA